MVTEGKSPHGTIHQGYWSSIQDTDVSRKPKRDGGLQRRRRCWEPGENTGRGEWMRITGMCIVTTDVARLRSFYAQVLRADATGDDTFSLVKAAGMQLSFFSVAGMGAMAPGS